MEDALTAATQLYDDGRFAEAIKECERAISDAPDHADAIKLLASLRYYNEDYQASLDCFVKAVGLRPNDPEIYINLSEVYRIVGRMDEAIEAARRGLELTPTSPEALNNLGMALCGQGQIDQAVKQFRLALGINPEFSAAHNNLGMALLAQEQFDDALIHFEQAVKFDPTSVFALSNLSQILLVSFRPIEALSYGEEAARLAPNDARIQCNLATILHDLGRSDEAQALYQKAGQLDPDLPKALAKAGMASQWKSDYEEALRFFEQASEIKPDDPKYLSHLARYHEELHEWSDAAVYWKRIIELLPTSARAHADLGDCLLNGECYTDALEEYQKAISLDPKCVAAHVGLSHAKTQIGDLAGAENILRSILPFAPVVAQAELAHLLGGKLPDADFTALEKFVSFSVNSDDHRTRLLSSFGHVLDGRGDYSRAAQIMRMVNDLRTSEAKERNQEYIRGDFERFVDAIIVSCGVEFFTRLSGHGLDTRRPVFVFGFPRSGTTLVEQILASHSLIHGAGELDLASRTFRSLRRVTQRANPPVDCFPFLDGQAISDLARTHLARLELIDNGRAQRIVDKTPDNYLHLGLLAAMFPNAVFIHCRRDPRDVVVSCWLINFKSLDYTVDFQDLAHRIIQYHKMMEHWRKVLPVQMHEVQYENLVEDFEHVAQSLINDCGLEWEAGCLNFQQTRRRVKTASITQVRQAIYHSSVGRWKNYERELADLFAMLPS